MLGRVGWEDSAVGCENKEHVIWGQWSDCMATGAISTLTDGPLAPLLGVDAFAFCLLQLHRATSPGLDTTTLVGPSSTYGSLSSLSAVELFQVLGASYMEGVQSHFRGPILYVLGVSSGYCPHPPKPFLVRT